MKKLIAIVLAVMLFCSAALAENVYVSISDDQGKLLLTALEVNATDVNNDGVVSIYDALFAAHEAAYEGGAEAGFKTEDTEFGLSMLSLWGVDNGGSFGYYVNNNFVYSLLDAVTDGDHVQAYAFTDLETWSDTYSYFDRLFVDGANEFELTLTALGYDADWNIIAIPVEGAVITLNGAATEFITDAEGKASVSLSSDGEYVISAYSDNMTLVPPVCIAKVG